MNESPIRAEAVLAAYQAIASDVRKTELRRSEHFSRALNANVFFKLENHQLTGSFKIRGVLNKLATLSDDERQNGIVAASTGNHGKACALVAQRQSMPCLILAPMHAAPNKLQAIADLGADIKLAGSDCGETESIAREVASQLNRRFISPYNDPHVIAGQGTIAHELGQQLQSIDAVFATVGGGGLISGIATYLSAFAPSCRVIGCSPENSNAMFRSMDAGRIIDVPSTETLSDGSAGGIEPNSITFDLCRRLISSKFSLTEKQIAEAMIELLDYEELAVEGAAAVALAGLKSFLQSDPGLIGKNVVVVLCGGNVSEEKLQSARSMVASG